MGFTIQDFDYHLPPEFIAQEPVEPRHESRLMVLDRTTETIEHRRFRDIVDYLRPADLLVANESRVIPARLYGRKIPTGGRAEVLLIAKRADDVWEALVKPGRRLGIGTHIEFSSDGLRVVGEIIGRTEAGGRLIRFSGPNVEVALEGLGVVPLPPYVHRPLSDSERYQTVYARVKGSVAAPTAGLHFTPELIARLQAKHVEFAFVTLHIGLDTFRPVQVQDIRQHRMHSEYAELSQEVADRINGARSHGGRIVAVGTTSVRVLETAAGHVEREAGSAEHPAPTGRVVAPFSGWTDIFIYPGYRYRAVDVLITNFHLPRSTLLMLVSAFAGRDFVLRAYQEAIAQGYRFYSFGDAMLIL
ncbi:MAG: tRNA preQ1(34) S-adenosylmethionine ribosyltransferase-isomerase QueA [Chloroflexota bacterium]